MSRFQSDTVLQQDSNNKIFGLDVIKSIAIVLVVSVHSGLWNVDFISSGLIQNALQYGCRLLCEGVPFFVMINGYLLLGIKKWDMQKHIMRTLKLLAVLLIWMAILIFVGSAICGEVLTIELFWNYYFATALASTYTGVLWFLENLIAVYLIFPILKAIYDRNTQMFLYLFFIFAFYSVGTHTINWIVNLVNLDNNVDLLYAVASFINRFNPTGNGYYVYCFMLGGICFCYKDWLIVHRKQLVFVGVLSSACVIALAIYLSCKTGMLQSTGFNYSSIFMTGIMVGLMGAFLPANGKNTLICKIINSFGSSTLGIYLLHFIIIWLFSRYLVFEDSFLFRLLKCVLIILISYLLTIVIRRIPIIRKIIQ